MNTQLSLRLFAQMYRIRAVEEEIGVRGDPEGRFVQAEQAEIHGVPQVLVNAVVSPPTLKNPGPARNRVLAGNAMAFTSGSGRVRRPGLAPRCGPSAGWRRSHTR